MVDWNRKTLALLVALAIAARIPMFFFPGFTADDAYITYRFAENLAEGRGFVYNSGENVQGTSTPLYTFILAGCSSIFGAQSMPWVSRGLGVIADAASLALIVRATASLGASSQFLSASLFALFPRLVFSATLGMETPLVVMMMMLSYLLHTKGIPGAACGVLGLLFVLRVDTSLWSAMMLTMMMRKEGRFAPRTLIPLIVPVAAWLLYAHMAFGSVVPHAMEAKSESWHHLFGAFDPGRVLLGYFPFHGLRDFPLIVKIVLCTLIVMPPVLILPGLFRRKDPLMIFPGFFLLYNGLYAGARVVMADWYYLPGWVSYVVSLGCFWSWLFSAEPERGAKARAERLLSHALVPALVVLLALGIYRWRQDPGEWVQNELVRVANWLAANAQAESSVMLEPIGEIGWVSNLYVHDEVGLVSPRILEYRRRFEGSDAWFLQYVKDVRPTYIVLQSREIRDNLLFMGHGDGIFRNDAERQWFFSHYPESGKEPDTGTDSPPQYVIYGPLNESRL
jgi:hypothetical protein